MATAFPPLKAGQIRMDGYPYMVGTYNSPEGVKLIKILFTLDLNEEEILYSSHTLDPPSVNHPIIADISDYIIEIEKRLEEQY